MFIICISVYSCSNNNPVTSVAADSTIDSARYNWREFIAPNDLNVNGVWIRDTNEIYLLNNPGLIKFSNGSFASITLDNFYPVRIACLDKNTAYLFGGRTGSAPLNLSVKKWNGFNFSDITTDTNSIGDVRICYFYKPNEIWLTGYNDLLYKFDGSTFTNFPITLPSGNNNIQQIFFDSTTHTLRALIWTSVGSDFKYSLYDFNGSSWNMTIEINLPNGTFPQSLAGYIVSKNKTEVNIFRNNVFSEFLQSRGFQFDYYIDGSLINNIMVGGIDKNTNDNYYYNWNGLKWSREFKHSNLYSLLIPFSDKFYLIINEKANILNIGTKK